MRTGLDGGISRVIRSGPRDAGPTPTPTTGGNWWDNPGPGGGGGTGPAGSSGGGGGIQGPSFEDSSGLYGSGKVPPGYVPIPDRPGYFWNDTTKSVGIASGSGATDLYGANPAFAWRRLTKAEQEAFISDYNASGGMTAYESATLAETQRQHRLADVYNAMDAITQRVQAAQKARLEGAQLAATPDMLTGPNAGYFPNLGPNSPLVQAGLTQPFKFQPVPLNPDAVAQQATPEQAALDLQRIRAAAGVGG